LKRGKDQKEISNQKGSDLRKGIFKLCPANWQHYSRRKVVRKKDTRGGATRQNGLNKNALSLTVQGESPYYYQRPEVRGGGKKIKHSHSLVRRAGLKGRSTNQGSRRRTRKTHNQIKKGDGGVAIGGKNI